MKRLAIDARLYSQTGVGTYLRNLLQNLPGNLSSDIELTVYLHETDAAQKDVLSFARVKTLATPWHSFAEQTELYHELMSNAYDLVHFPYFGYPVLYTKPFIATIHDVTPLLFKTGKASTKNPVTYFAKHLVFSYVLRTQARNAKAIITPTETVRHQLCELYKDVAESKITAIYEGVDSGLIHSSLDVSVVKTVQQPYILYVGNFYPHNYVELLLDVWSRYDIPYTLVCAGPDDFFSSGMVQKTRDLGIDQKVRFVTSNSRSQLKGLYQHAKALIHPSLSEGFGLPLVEAMYFGLPIVASDIPVFKELLRKDYFPFSVDSSESVYHAIQQLSKMNHSPDYTDNLKRFSFQQMSKKTAQLYSQLI